MSKTTEPKCSPFNYEEKLLEKMVRMEFKMEQALKRIDDFEGLILRQNRTIQGLPRPSSTLPPPLSPETTIYLQTINIPLSNRNQQERTSGSRDDGTRLINRAARGSSHIRPSSGDITGIYSRGCVTRGDAR
ncbi:hypothetical protein DPMN_096591 [Dreissena polymorpha]|uniref:Uncharacterized protein n=1 Tax=Dreissena polymorpha TaxID=45954 RepID=A0A9D4LBD1_DREPO|nr:hypothetical protein DPMN_096591 [Dreissena polymorpha]